MLLSISKFGVRAVAFGVAVVITAVVVVLLRLAAAPIEVDFLSPYVADALTFGDGAYRVDFERTELTFDQHRPGFVIQVGDARLLDGDGNTMMTLPRLSVDFALRDLLRGDFRTRVVMVSDLKLRLVRHEDRALSLRALDPPAAGAEAPAIAVDELIEQVAAAARDVPAGGQNDEAAAEQRAQGLGRLERLSVDGLDLEIEDRLSGTVWRVLSASLGLTGGDDALAASGKADLAFGDARVGVDIEGTLDPETLAADATMRIRPTRIDRLAAALGGPDFLGEAKVIVGGTADVHMRGNRLYRASFALGGDGRMAWPGVLEHPLEIEAFELDGRVADDFSRVGIDRAEVRFADGMSMTGYGVVEGVGRDLDALVIGGDVSIRDIDVARLNHYWPIPLETEGRRWVVENIPRGRVPRLDVAIDFPRGSLAAEDLDPSGVTGRFGFDNLLVHYQRPLPAVDQLAGEGWFDLAGLHFAADSGGRIAGKALSLGASTIDVAPFGPDEPTAVSVNTAIVGALDDALAILAMPPIEFTRELDIDPAKAGGRVVTDFAIAVPIGRGADSSDLRFSADAVLNDVALRDVIFGYDADGGKFSLHVDQTGAELSGTGRLNGVPLRLTWRQSLDGGEDWRSRVHAEGRLDDEARRALGAVDVPYMTGPVQVAVNVTVPRARSAVPLIDVGADLGPARFDVGEIAWSKPAGAPGRLEVTARPMPDGVVEIDRFEIRTDDLTADGRARVREGEVELVDVEHISLRENDAHFVYRIGEDKRRNLDIRGRRLDLTPYLDTSSGEGDAVGGDDGSAEQDRRERDASPPLDVTIAVAEVVTAPGRRVGPASGHVTIADGAWREAGLTADLPGGGKATVSLTAAGEGRRVVARSDDMGALLHALDIGPEIVGGEITLTADIRDERPGSPVDGEVLAQDYRIKRAPTLARLLALASLTGISDLLGGEGLGFARFYSDFAIADKVLTIKDTRAYGSALGLTAKGDVYLAEDRMDIEGTIVPAYTINSVLGNVPLIGQILTGGDKGSGVFAATFKASGAVEDPRITVNPVAALAPGFLRNLFSVFEGGEAAVPEGTPAYPGGENGNR